MKQADVVIIGSGQGGVPLAVEMAQNGRSVFIFERAHWGGTCVNTGCIPSKTLLVSAHAAAAARQAQDLGVQAQVEVDFTAVMQRTRQSIHPESIKNWLEENKVNLVEAEAELIGPHTIRGGDVIVEAKTIIINTGKSPFIPDIPGLDETPYLTYETFWQLDKLPGTLAVLGGGFIGLEMAQAMQRLGSQVHVIETKDRPIADEEEDVSQALQQALVADGVRFHLNTRVNRVEHKSNVFWLTLDTAVDSLLADALLLAVGRRPNVEALQLPNWGIGQDDHDHIQVDDHFRTTAAGVYAIGDVIDQPAFTHVSWEDHRRLLAILDGQERHQGDRVLGYAFFTEPQVGRVGLTLDQAIGQGFKARAATLSLSQVARAAATNHDNGFYRLVIDDETERILGATLVGSQTAELIHIIMAHMEAGSNWHVLERSQHIHPTYAEALPSLARKFKQ